MSLSSLKAAVYAEVSIAMDLSLKPQAKTVLRHLKKKGHISPAEALIVYGISRLAASIYDIRNVGYEVDTEVKHDAQNHKYARYTLVA
jgi:glutamate synthase domain-containing protein 2